MRSYSLSSFLIVCLIMSVSCNNSLNVQQLKTNEKKMVNYPNESPHFAQMRSQMVQRQIAGRDVHDPLVLKAMGKIQRHLFVPLNIKDKAYVDSPLPLTDGQTISQPYIVAFMTQAAQLKGGERVLEIGTGSGYQAAVLAEIVQDVYTIEIVEPLAVRSKQLLTDLKYTNIQFKTGDGYAGWKEFAPFDAIIVTAAPPMVPRPLIDQLKEGGRLIIPVGTNYQELKRYIKDSSAPQQVRQQKLLPVRFVPMTGKAQEEKK